ncbi:MAG: GTP cyclohydrolase IIa [Candidatus Hadarchaeales archaeon]
MRKIQLTLVQIDNYGPWTVTPVPRREADLQALQAELYAELEKRFGALGGLVFYARFDNVIAVTNGIGLEQHREIVNEINSGFPVTVSMGIGAAAKPYDAQVEATLALQRAGGSRSEYRRGVVAGCPVVHPDEDWVQIAHIDVNHSTLITDSEPIYDTHMLLQRTYLALASSLYRKKALVFYTGGDNFMALSNGIGLPGIEETFADVKREIGFGLKAGVGAARSAETAAKLASEGLHEIRRGAAGGQLVYKSEE